MQLTSAKEAQLANAFEGRNMVTGTTSTNKVNASKPCQGHIALPNKSQDAVDICERSGWMSSALRPSDQPQGAVDIWERYGLIPSVPSCANLF